MHVNLRMSLGGSEGENEEKKNKKEKLKRG